jgi:hypothetical protein
VGASTSDTPVGLHGLLQEQLFTVHIVVKILKLIATHLFCESGNISVLNSEAAALSITAAHYSCMLFEWQLIK